MTHFGGLVWSLCRRAGLLPEEAEDVVQETFLDVWRIAPRYDAKLGSETTFIAVVARRRIIDARRRAKRRLDTEPMPETAAAPVATGAATDVGAEVSLATRALDQLRPEQKQVLMLSACEGMSHEEISRATGMPLGTVKAHARRGLIRVREVLAEQRRPS